MIRGLPERLVEKRLERKLTQKEVADAIDIASSLISNYENGERTPSLENMMLLSSFYRTSIDYLVGAQKHESVLLDTTGLDDGQRRALRIYLNELTKIADS